MNELRLAVGTGCPDDTAGPRSLGRLALVTESLADGGRRLSAYAHGGAVASVEARVTGALEDAGLTGVLSRFESVNSTEAARMVLRRAAQWLGGAGAVRVIGPMEADTWHRYRLTTGPFDEPPFSFEPWNPSYYHDLWCAAGFEPLLGFYSKRLDDLELAHARLARKRELARALGYELRPVDPGRFDDDLVVMYRIASRSFARAPFYRPIPIDVFARLYQPMRAVLEPSLVWIATSRRGDEAGFIFSYAEPGTAGEVINAKTIAVAPAHRARGLDSALVSRIYAAALDRGIPRVNFCLVRDGNPSGSLDARTGRVFRRYALYQFEG